MKFCKVQHIFHTLGLAGDTPQKRFCNGQTADFMLICMEHPIPFFCTDGFSKIMGQCCQHKPVRIGGFAAQFCRFIQHQHGMVPDISFCMEHRVLGNADQCFQFRKPDVQLIHLTQYREENRRPLCFQQCFFQLSFNAFPWQMLQCHPAAQGYGFRSNPEIKPCGKLGSTQNPQGILCEGISVHVPQKAIAQISTAAEVIHNLTGENVLHQRIYRKIPAAGSRFGADKGINKDVKIFVSLAAGRFFPGHGNVQRIAFQSENAKAFTDCHLLAKGIQDTFQISRGNAVHFNIQILVLFVHQSIPDIPAYIISTAALQRYPPGQFPGHGMIVRMVHGVLLSCKLFSAFYITGQWDSSQGFLCLQDSFFPVWHGTNITKYNKEKRAVTKYDKKLHKVTKCACNVSWDGI